MGRSKKYFQPELEGVDWSSHVGQHPLGFNKSGPMPTEVQEVDTLSDNPNHVTGYHVTQRHNLDSIMQRGLYKSNYDEHGNFDGAMPRGKNRNGVYIDPYEPRTEYGDTILQVSAHHRRTKEDPLDEDYGHLIVTHHVPPKNIQLVGHTGRNYSFYGAHAGIHWGEMHPDECASCNMADYHFAQLQAKGAQHD